MNDDSTFPGLPKWPAFVVKGEAVTQEQAAEIIIRTSRSLDFSYACNDRDWCRQLNEAVGLAADPFGGAKGGWEQVQEVDKRYGLLSLEYLGNGCIASAYIGGPGGWIDWTGNVRTGPGQNIGKWPSCEAVLEDWQKIAAAWPFLDLRCQLWSAESGEEGPSHAVIEYVVKDGTVTVLQEVPSPMHPERMDMAGNVLGLLSPASLRERGCTLEQFEGALELTAKALEE